MNTNLCADRYNLYMIQLLGKMSAEHALTANMDTILYLRLTWDNISRVMIMGSRIITHCNPSSEKPMSLGLCIDLIMRCVLANTYVCEVIVIND